MNLIRLRNIMNRLGPHVMVEKISPLKRAVCHRKRSALEAEDTLLERIVRTQIELEQKKIHWIP